MVPVVGGHGHSGLRTTKLVYTRLGKEWAITVWFDASPVYFYALALEDRVIVCDSEWPHLN
jgi:hypothetical protein